MIFIALHFLLLCAFHLRRSHLFCCIYFMTFAYFNNCLFNFPEPPLCPYVIIIALSWIRQVRVALQGTRCYLYFYSLSTFLVGPSFSPAVRSIRRACCTPRLKQLRLSARSKDVHCLLLKVIKSVQKKHSWYSSTGSLFSQVHSCTIKMSGPVQSVSKLGCCRSCGSGRRFTLYLVVENKIPS